MDLLSNIFQPLFLGAGAPVTNVKKKEDVRNQYLERNRSSNNIRESLSTGHSQVEPLRYTP